MRMVAHPDLQWSQYTSNSFRNAMYVWDHNQEVRGVIPYVLPGSAVESVHVEQLPKCHVRMGSQLRSARSDPIHPDPGVLPSSLYP